MYTIVILCMVFILNNQILPHINIYNRYSDGFRVALRKRQQICLFYKYYYK
jgi:hypothetical protein